jgi:predicted HD phosphohydrolase
MTLIGSRRTTAANSALAATARAGECGGVARPGQRGGAGSASAAESTCTAAVDRDHLPDTTRQPIRIVNVIRTLRTTRRQQPAVDSGLAALIALLTSLDGVFDAPPPDGDPVDLSQHGLHCADLLRTRRPDDVGRQLAGLVHDVGHAAGGGEHAVAGAATVRPVLGDRVADLVAAHVDAKRYLAAVERDYELSPPSVTSLDRQGGAMTPGERKRFTARPDAADAIRLRRADEAAKVVGRVVPGLAAWVPRLRAYAGRAAS